MVISSFGGLTNKKLSSLLIRRYIVMWKRRG